MSHLITLESDELDILRDALISLYGRRKAELPQPSDEQGEDVSTEAILEIAEYCKPLHTSPEKTLELDDLQLDFVSEALSEFLDQRPDQKELIEHLMVSCNL